jgi:beta-ketoacyl-acyl-carrier-protein synthase II
MREKRRVAVTGIGIVSPLGNDVTSTWNSLMTKQSGIAEIQQFDARGFPTRIAAEVKGFTPSAELCNKKNRFAISFTNYALEAALQAFENANIRPTAQTDDRWGVVVGSGMMTAEFNYLQRFQQTCASGGEIDWAQLHAKSSEFHQLLDFGKTTSNTGLSMLVQQFGIRGYASSVHTACASGGQALGLALQVIRRGDADYMLAGGFDSMINPLGLSSFCLLGALSTYNETPKAASRPFDATRNGFVLGEGAAFLILEEWEKAKTRGAQIYAELAGEGNTLSSYRITDSHPNGDGAIQAIQNALADAGVLPSDVDYINAHGTSTKMNDLSETNAIKAVFGEDAFKLPVSSTKSQTGHLIAAAGALEAALSILSIQHGQIPMTANLTSPDPECDLDYVVEGPREKSVGVVLSNSFGFGGSNSSLVFKHPEFRGVGNE